MPSEVRIIGLQGVPDIASGADLPLVISEAAQSQGFPFASGDILVVTQKIVSKAEGALRVAPDDDAYRAIVAEE